MFESTYKNTTTAGIVRPPPNKKNEPGIMFIVALYTALYIGPYIKGIRASHTPNNELIFPKISDSNYLQKSGLIKRSKLRRELLQLITMFIWRY